MVTKGDVPVTTSNMLVQIIALHMTWYHAGMNQNILQERTE